MHPNAFPFRHPEYQYLDLLYKVLSEGTLQANRTGTPAWTIDGAMMQFDMEHGFPLLTTKQMYYKGAFAEMIGFLRGLDNAQDFADLGCNWWFKDANENTQWLASPFRKGENDLGRIYGVQWRRQRGNIETCNTPNRPVYREIDQVQQALIAIHYAIKTGVASRRIIIDAWAPGEFAEMALPPCHVAYEFMVNVEKRELNMSMWQRSCDMFLGVPMNIASSSLLLHLVAAATGLKAKLFTHFLSDVHIYDNHTGQVSEQLKREPKPFPELVLPSSIDPTNWGADQLAAVDPKELVIEGYQHHPAIKGEMSTG